MGTASINCNVSLSKKLRNLLKDGELGSVVLTVDLKDGKGTGKLSLTGALDDLHSDISEIGETSIQITPKDYADETPNGDSIPQGTIFSTIPKKGENAPVINKMAAVHAPDKGDESHAVVPKERVRTPKEFSSLNDPECMEWISNMEELIGAVMDAKAKKSDIDPDMAHNDREKALLIELKEKDEAIDRPAWIINSGAGTLIINDLDITLPINSPYDLSNISARRIIMSRDLKELIKAGYIKFLSPAEKDNFIANNNDEVDKDIGLPVFDSPAEAEAYMSSTVSSNPVINEESVMNVTEEDVDSATDEESMIINLTQGMPEKNDSTRQASSNAGSRHTVHGNKRQSSAQNPKVNTIRKLT